MLSKKFWEKYFHVYDALNELIPYDELLATIVRELELQGGERVFDAGSGTGNLALRIHKAGATAIGLDLSETGTELHRRKVPGAHVVLGDITARLPFADASFDKAASNNVLYTLPKSTRQGVLHELYRILKPGGVVVVSNIMVNFRPIQIYRHHLRQDIERSGYIEMLLRTLRFVAPTIKIFYYNWRIKRAHGSMAAPLMTEAEQRALLKQAGFREISVAQFPYVGQAVLHRARK